MPRHPSQRQAESNEREEVDGSRAVTRKREVFLFALNSGSSHCTKSLVVTLKIIGYDSCDSAPVRTKLSNLKPKHLGYTSELLISLKKFGGQGKKGGEPEDFTDCTGVPGSKIKPPAFGEATHSHLRGPCFLGQEHKAPAATLQPSGFWLFKK